MAFLSSSLKRVFRSPSGVAALVAAALSLPGIGDGSVGATSEGGTRAFLVTRSNPAFYYGSMEVDCPSGFERTVEELFQATLAPAERERLLRPENAREYGEAWKEGFTTGPGGENICNNPKSFLGDPRHPPHRGVQSKVAFGLNLDGTVDGRATAKSCGHPKFEGLNGEPAVDNQLYRAMGCAKVTRGAGENVQPERGLDLYLIELRGVDDLRNDNAVDVGIYSTDDPSMVSQGGAHLPLQSFRATANPRWRAKTRARIVDGLLTTDVIDTLLLRWRVQTTGLFGQASEHEFRDVRFQLSLQPDGTVKGIMGGYRPIENISTNYRCCKSAATAANRDCASEHAAFVAMADGYPDPGTGQCTMISSAMNVVGIPAFVIHDSSASLSGPSARGQ